MPQPRPHLPRRAIRTVTVAGLALIALLAAAVSVPPAPGSVAPAAAAAAGDFRLPYPAGLKLYTLQGQNQGSHIGPYNRYAYDFATGPFDNTPFVVVAARAGKVVRVVQSYGSSADCDLGTYSQSNYVLLDHGDNVGTSYSHLLQNSVRVKPGDQVAQGQPLALSNHSGYICGVSHLHFTVLNLKTMVGLDFPFADPALAAVGGRPQTNHWYVSANPPSTQQAAGSPRYQLFLPVLQRQHRR